MDRNRCGIETIKRSGFPGAVPASSALHHDSRSPDLDAMLTS